MSWLDRLRRKPALPAGLVPADEVARRARRDAAVAPLPSQHELRLRARRDALTERFTLLQADLGGTFYEMAIRDHVRMDVLTRKAAELQRVDAELQRVEDELRGPQPAAPGFAPVGQVNGSGA